jgi:transposase-like protein
MGGRPRVDRTPGEKWQIVQEGIKSGNVSETCRRHGISPSLFPHVRRTPRPDNLPGAAQVSSSKGPPFAGATDGAHGSNTFLTVAHTHEGARSTV